MRIIPAILIALLVLIQYPLWLGSGGWITVAALEDKLQARQAKVDQLSARNAKLESEVDDLKDGVVAVEEKARYDLGMIKVNEIFIQVVSGSGQPASVSTPRPQSADLTAGPALGAR